MRRAQSIIGGAFMVLLIAGVVLLVWSTTLGGLIGQWGGAAVSNNNLTGTTAFLWSNTNLFVIIGLAVFVIAGFSAVRT